MSKAWDKFWFSKVPPHGLALLRIALGAYLLLYALLYAPHIPMLASSEGLVLPRLADTAPAFAWLLMPPSSTVAYAVYALGILAIVGFTAGAWFRVCCGLLLGLAWYYWQLQLHLFPTSYNRIVIFCLVVLLCSGANRTFSWDQKRRTGSAWNWEHISVLPQRLIAMQITVTFLGVSLQKWWLPHWQGGEVLAYAFVARWATPVGRWFAQLQLPLEVYDALVLMVKICQPLAAVGMWFKRTRVASFIFLSLFILLVAGMMSIWWFIYVIPACIVFIGPHEAQKYCMRRFPHAIAKDPTK